MSARASSQLLPEHRGRLQAQGPDIEQDRAGNGHGNISRGWAQNQPYLASKAYTDLEAIRTDLTGPQADARRFAFAKARIFIQRAQSQGGLDHPVSATFPRLKRSDTAGVRVDIEVKAGRAFV